MDKTAMVAKATFLLLTIILPGAKLQVKAVSDNNQPRFQRRLPRSESSPAEVQQAYLAQQVNQLSADVQALTARVDDLTTENRRLQGEVTRLQGLEAEVAQSDETMQRQEARLQALTNDLTVFQADSSEQSHTQSKAVARLNSTVEDIQAKVTAIDFRHNVTDYRLQVQTGRVDILESRMTSLDLRTSQEETMTQALSSWRANVTTEMDKILNTQEQLLTDQDALSENLRQLSSDSSTLHSDVTKLASDWSRLKSNVTTLFSDTDSLRNELTQMNTQLGSFSHSVQFFARLSQDLSHSSSAIVLDEVLANHGGAYNATTGNFTAPMGGDYLITAMPMPERTFSNTPRIALMVDDQRVFVTDSDHSSLSVALRLRLGQGVWLRSLFTSSYGAGMYFSGVLVRPVLSG